MAGSVGARPTENPPPESGELGTKLVSYDPIDIVNQFR
jgi:hypothetical protein